MLAGQRYHLAASEKTRTPEVRKGGKLHARAAKPMSQEMALWEAAGAHCSANERRADEASRDVEAWLKCRFMRERLGEEFAGTVSAVTSFGLFVTLDALYVDGLVHITELGGEYYRFDEARQELRGERTGVRYAVGTRVRVQVSRVDLDGRKIDFRMVREGEGDAAGPRRHGTRPTGAVAELAGVRESDRAVKAGGARSKGKGGTAERGARSRKPGAAAAGAEAAHSALSPDRRTALRRALRRPALRPGRQRAAVGPPSGRATVGRAAMAPCSIGGDVGRRAIRALSPQAGRPSRPARRRCRRWPARHCRSG